MLVRCAIFPHWEPRITCLFKSKDWQITCHFFKILKPPVAKFHSLDDVFPTQSWKYPDRNEDWNIWFNFDGWTDSKSQARTNVAELPLGAIRFWKKSQRFRSLAEKKRTCKSSFQRRVLGNTDLDFQGGRFADDFDLRKHPSILLCCFSISGWQPLERLKTVCQVWCLHAFIVAVV